MRCWATRAPTAGSASATSSSWSTSSSARGTVADAVAAGRDDVHVIGFGGCYPSDYAHRMLEAALHAPERRRRRPGVAGLRGVRPGGARARRGRLRPAGDDARHPAGRRHPLDRRPRPGVGRRGPRPVHDRADRAHDAGTDLVVGTICGGSDGTSGITANPVVGRVFDRHVAAGGTARLRGDRRAHRLRAPHGGARRDPGARRRRSSPGSRRRPLTTRRWATAASRPATRRAGSRRSRRSRSGRTRSPAAGRSTASSPQASGSRRPGSTCSTSSRRARRAGGSPTSTTTPRSPRSSRPGRTSSCSPPGAARSSARRSRRC